MSDANLGLATTEELIREVICRLTILNTTFYTDTQRALLLAEMLGGMSAPEREYKTTGEKK